MIEDQIRIFTVESLDRDDVDVQEGLHLMKWDFQENADGTITFTLAEGFTADDWGDEVEFYDGFGQLMAHFEKSTRLIRFY